MNTNFWLMLMVVAVHCRYSLSICEAYKHPDNTQIDRCATVLKVYEGALVSDKNNLFILQDTFLSNAHHAPSLLTITYQEEYRNDNNVTYYILHQTGWSTSSVFVNINPVTFYAIQSGILSIIFWLEDIAFPHNIILTLTIKPEQLPPNVQEEEISYAINAITERLKAYAIHQEKLSEWDGSDKGFAFDPTLLGSLSVFVTLIIATILLVIFAIIMAVKFLVSSSTWRHYERNHIQVSIFWSFVQIVAIYNFFEWLLGLVVFITLFLLEPSSVSVYPITKGIILITSLLIGTIGTLIGCTCNQKYLPPIPEREKPCCCTESFCRRYDYCFSVSHFFLFFYFVTVSIIPVVILAFVYPVIILSTVAYICTSLFCIIAVFALPSSCSLLQRKFKSSGDVQKFQTHCIELCNASIYLIPLTVLSLMMFPFLCILSNTEYTHSSDFFQDASSFLPSVLLGAIGYLAKRKLSKNSKQKQEKLNVTECKDSDALKLAEEGKQKPATSGKESTPLLTDTC